MYLSPSTRHFFDDPTHYGCMFNIVKQIGGQWDALEAGCYWILDNGQYRDKWTWTLWWKFLQAMLSYTDRCLGIAIPDRFSWIDKRNKIPRSDNHILTLHYFKVYHQIVKDLGYPVALVTQDGMTPEMIPWHLIDCLFVGGTDYHKRQLEADALISEAKRLGKWVHIGRVQAGSTMLTYWPQADSFDGTTLIKNPIQQVKSINNGLDRIKQGNVPYTIKMF